ncbi:hypothetical protein [Pseudomonas sp.]|uniref:hypothetical protein n=1 Tax=Pseudomonas sp. TaxID=306 RepID=UPI002FC60180
MKISNSKKQLAKIISENGGWRYGAGMAAQQKIVMSVEFWTTSGKLSRVRGEWIGCGHMGDRAKFLCDKMMPNHHQTTLSRDEYFHLHPAPDADGWIEWEGGECPCPGASGTAKRADGVEIEFNERQPRNWRHDKALMGGTQIISYRLHKLVQAKSTAVGDDETNLAAKEELAALEFELTPTIEQLAADYRAKLKDANSKQDEADKANMEADAALSALQDAMAAIGFAIMPVAAEEEEAPLNITDWRDLQFGDELEYLDGDVKIKIGMIGNVDLFDEYSVSGKFVRINNGGILGWPKKWRFIRRP